ncbi:hypothetical protein [Lysobacter capsici]|uniref:hypothetical protein n=1 Tax=Lysobacter capsici TaxID=435897 RepID=UPI000627CDE3|nr:hypothetical protein [Lysobacter capsici]
MSRMIATLCLFVLVAVCSTDASAKQHFVRQQGDTCGEDSKIVATCAAGLSCKGGYCEQNSYLSAASASCREIMIKAGVIGARETVPVHDGFCYKHCDGMYERAMAASEVTTRLLLRASAGSQAFAEEFAKLSDSEKASFKTAEDKCNSCGRQCTIGAGFLGRGGY